ncbi:unnamed protein product [Linum tenue]|uniref:Uncharacterized protein n=1 Tax=Linum tenue TaxID=586396 RepID=A0AAV0HIW4_9ROSI|nr:unnamed protein product [Linum tenue]
MSPRVPRALY